MVNLLWGGVVKDNGFSNLDQERIKYYLNNCADETRLRYKQFIDSAMTTDVIKDLCNKNVSDYNLPAEVIFEK